MTDLVERHKPREGSKPRTTQVRKPGVPVTAPVHRKSEDSPQRTGKIDAVLVDHGSD
jgi:hypothetical protein